MGCFLFVTVVAPWAYIVCHLRSNCIIFCSSTPQNRAWKRNLTIVTPFILSPERSKNDFRFTENIKISHTRILLQHLYFSQVFSPAIASVDTCFRRRWELVCSSGVSLPKCVKKISKTFSMGLAALETSWSKVSPWVSYFIFDDRVSSDVHQKDQTVRLKKLYLFQYTHCSNHETLMVRWRKYL